MKNAIKELSIKKLTFFLLSTDSFTSLFIEYKLSVY